MNESRSESYRQAGVDITAGYRAVDLMKAHIARTITPGVVSGVGGFAGMFAPDLTGIARPVLVSGTDGVGTKIKIAFALDSHDTVGIDCVAMCVNDVVCSGAAPLFFLDYIACGRLVPEKAADLVKGVAEGCVRAGCALIGGETAEMPGLYAEGEYDIAGCTVGLGDLDRLFDREKVRKGDALVALPSTGLHSNGFSLVRKVLGDSFEALSEYSDELGKTVGEELRTPTWIYVRPVLAAAKEGLVKSAAHITGGGFYENLPRAMPAGLCAKIEKSALRPPPVFGLLMKKGSIPERDMFNTFNMGVGMVLAAAPENADRLVSLLRENGEQAFILGEAAAGEGVDLL